MHLLVAQIDNGRRQVPGFVPMTIEGEKLRRPEVFIPDESRNRPVEDPQPPRRPKVRGNHGVADVAAKEHYALATEHRAAWIKVAPVDALIEAGLPVHEERPWKAARHNDCFRAGDIALVQAVTVAEVLGDHDAQPCAAGLGIGHHTDSRLLRHERPARWLERLAHPAP